MRKNMIGATGNNRGLSGNVLKIVAALSMTVDHIGVILFPDVVILREIGRIAFPIYAFMIAEGCAYTKNKLRYFLTVFVLGIAFQIVYYLYGASLEMGILITFSLSILVVYAMQHLKKVWLAENCSQSRRRGAILIVLSVLVGVYLLNRYLDIDYGFWGCMAPAFASLFRKTPTGTASDWDKLDTPKLHVLMLGISLIVLSCGSDPIQFFSLLAIPLLLLYSGKRGKYKMKAFFYIFYPAHLVILELVSMIL